MGEAGIHDLGEGSSHVGIKFQSILSLQRDAFTYKGFYTGRGLHTEMVLRREMILQRDASSYRCSYVTQRYFQHRDAFTHGCFKIQILLYRDDFANTGTFTQRCFYTGVFTC